MCNKWNRGRNLTSYELWTKMEKIKFYSQIKGTEITVHKIHE